MRFHEALSGSCSRIGVAILTRRILAPMVVSKVSQAKAGGLRYSHSQLCGSCKSPARLILQSKSTLSKPHSVSGDAFLIDDA
jgi:hypothetical protein